MPRHTRFQMLREGGENDPLTAIEVMHTNGRGPLELSRPTRADRLGVIIGGTLRQVAFSAIQHQTGHLSHTFKRARFTDPLVMERV